MPALSSRRDFLRRTGLIALAAPLAATAIEGCANVAATTSNKASLLRVGWTIEPDSMNPLTAYSTEADEILALRLRQPHALQP